jgi:hypothetical protein
MRLSRILMLSAAVLMSAAPVAMAQGRGGGRPAAAGRPASPGSQGKRPADAGARAGDHANANKGTKGKSGDARGTSGRDDRGPKDRTDADTTARAGDNRGDMTVAQRIAANPQQKARIEAMLPTGMTLEQAATGFRNQGQFIAAVEASKNQNIPFASLKTEMTGTNQLSLGEAIQKLKPAPTTTTTTTTTTTP